MDIEYHDDKGKFKPGNPGSNGAGGRPTGSRNKIKRLVAALEEIGFDPLAFALDKISKADENKQADLAMELLQMVHGRPREERKLSGESNNPEQSVANANNLMEELKKLSEPRVPKDDKPTA